jgi:hypothetical protein
VLERKKPFRSSGSAANPKLSMSITLSALVTPTHLGRRCRSIVRQRRVKKFPLQFATGILYPFREVRGRHGPRAGSGGGGGLAPLTAIQTRPLPTEVKEDLITVITVTEKSGQNGRTSVVVGEEKRREGSTAERKRPFRICVFNFYTCSLLIITIGI